jgi:hypothetical protein
MKLNPKVYRKAAKGVANRKYFNFACVEILRADKSSNAYEHREAFINLFFPPSHLSQGADEHSAWGDLWGETKQERKNCRILALLFMAEIADE